MLDTCKPVIVSLGNVGHNQTDLNMTAYEMWQGYPSVSLLYCVTNYPTQLHEFDMANLELVHGLSSHCPLIAPSLYAVAQGCDVLENHVTLDRQMEGCDQAASLTFEEFAQMADIVRQFETVGTVYDRHC
jgi:N,N'-diacetyllegionaminate synthase